MLLASLLMVPLAVAPLRRPPAAPARSEAAAVLAQLLDRNSSADALSQAASSWKYLPRAEQAKGAAALQAALTTALSAGPVMAMEPATCHRTPAELECAPDFFAAGCTPRVGWLARAAADSFEARAVSPGLARQLLDSGHLAVRRVALDLLVLAKDPRGEALSAAQLDHADLNCRHAAAERLAPLLHLAPQTQAAVDAVVASSTDDALVATLEGAAWNGAAPSNRGVRRMLQRPTGRAKLDLLKALAQHPASAQPWIGPLALLAACDPTARVRALATQALTPWTQSVVRPTCPSSLWSIEGDVLSKGATHLTLSRRGPATFSAPCPPDGVADGALALGLVGTACLMGTSLGEFGGVLSLRDATGMRFLIRASSFNPVGLVRQGESLFVLSNLETSGRGFIHRLSTDGGRTLRLEPWLPLPGGAAAWGVAGDQLVVTQRTLDLAAPCDVGAGPPPTDVTWLISPDRSVTVARQAGWGCLGPP